MAERATPRQLIGGLSAITIFISIAFSVIEAESVFGIKTIFILVFIFGLTTMPLYSLSAIHANNQIKEQDMTMLSASLIFPFGIGAIVSPVIASYIIEHFGPLSMFTYFAAMHLFLLGYTGYRALIRPLNVPLRPYIYIPRTSLFIAKTIKKSAAASSLICCNLQLFLPRKTFCVDVKKPYKEGTGFNHARITACPDFIH